MVSKKWVKFAYQLKYTEVVMYMCGHTYDNSANMSGKYNGMQAKLCDINPLALYVPCAAHSLHLIGVCAVESCVEATNFFSLVQKLFTFFSASTSRWGILVQYLEGEKRVLKCLSDTQWSARAEATKALSGYDNIRAALLHIVQDPEQRADTQQEANGLHIPLSYLDTVFMAVFWNIILERFNGVSMIWLFKVLKLS